MHVFIFLMILNLTDNEVTEVYGSFLTITLNSKDVFKATHLGAGGVAQCAALA